ncbi:MAG: hypothetical protein ACRD1T_13245 [Acidimicrobiia bacterium]
MHSITRLIFASLVLALLAGPAVAQPVGDPAGDFFPIYVGPPQGDLDVINGGVLFTGNGFLFFATMNDAIGEHPKALNRYVWGVDRGHRGEETRSFARLGLPNIIFDSVVVLRPGVDLIVRDLVTDLPTQLPMENVLVLGNNILVVVPLSVLPSRGFLPEEYSWNLWPRWDGIEMSDEQISDFAPDDQNAAVIVVR